MVDEGLYLNPSPQFVIQSSAVRLNYVSKQCYVVNTGLKRILGGCMDDLFYCDNCRREFSKNVPECPVCREKICPVCGSSSISSKRRGFRFGMAVVGATLFGKAGLLLGMLGRNKIDLVCSNCGHRWTYDPEESL